MHSLLQECDGPFKICMAEVEQNRMTCAQAKLIQIIPEVNQACEIQGFMKKKKKKLAEFANSVVSFKKT